MIDFFINIFSAFYNLLPDSFIQNLDLFSEDGMSFIANFLNYLNWIVPFDIASRILAIWLPCILAYYLASTLRTVYKKLLRIFLENL